MRIYGEMIEDSLGVNFQFEKNKALIPGNDKYAMSTLSNMASYCEIYK